MGSDKSIDRREKFEWTDDIKVGEPFLEMLYKDMVKCDEMLDKNDGGFSRRNYVRCSFALIQGTMYFVKVGLRGLPLTGDNLKALTMLQDDIPQVLENGKLGRKTLRHPFQGECAFILREQAKAVGMEADRFLLNNHGFKELANAVKIRDRLTHPKTANDLAIGDDEIITVSIANAWFFNCYSEIAKKARSSTSW